MGGAAGPISVITGLRLFRSTEGEYSTDSTSLFEVFSLSSHVDRLILHCYVVRGAARDPVDLGSTVEVVSLGKVRNGRQLYLRLPFSMWRLWRSARRNRWSVAYLAQTGPLQIAALVVCALTGRRVLAGLRGDGASTGRMVHRHALGWRRLVGEWNRLVHAGSQRLFASTVPVVVDSTEMLERVVQWGGSGRLVAASSVRSLDIVAGRPTWAGPQAGPLRLLWVGRIEPVKDLSTLLRALDHVLGSGRAVSLLLIGNGNSGYIDEIRKELEELGLEEAVRFMGPVPNGPALHREYLQSDVLVISSRSEGSPKVVPEAYANGVPVVATGVGDLPRTVSEATGRVVSPEDPAALAAAICDIYDHPQLLTDMSAAARQAALTMTREETSIRLLEAILQARVPGWRRRNGLGE